VSRGVAFVIAAAGVVTGCAHAGDPNDIPADAPKATIDAPIAKTDAPTAKTDAPPVDATPASVDAPAATCTTSATCATAMELSGIGGDETGASTSSASGYQAAWYSIRVSETDSGAFADPMSMQATLTSPSGAMFDLLVFVPGDATSTDCSSPTGTVSTSGATETWSLEWGETGTFANDSDDSRTIAIQISPRSTDSCSPDATWSLSIVTGFD
jgi:hypothetical protein